MTDLFFCEYSTKQQCFHISKVSKALLANANGIVHNFGLDFIPFAIAKDYRQANAFCDEMLELMAKAKRATKVDMFKKPSFCLHPEENCWGCEYNALPGRFDPCCTLERGKCHDVLSTDDE